MELLELPSKLLKRYWPKMEGDCRLCSIHNERMAFVEPNKGRVFGLGGHLVWKECGESSSSQVSNSQASNPAPVVEDVAQIKEQLSLVLDFIKKYFPERSLEQFASERRTPGTDHSAAASNGSISATDLAHATAAAAAFQNLGVEDEGEVSPSVPMEEDGDGNI